MALGHLRGGSLWTRNRMRFLIAGGRRRAHEAASELAGQEICQECQICQLIPPPPDVSGVKGFKGFNCRDELGDWILGRIAAFSNLFTHAWPSLGARYQVQAGPSSDLCSLLMDRVISWLCTRWSYTPIYLSRVRAGLTPCFSKLLGPRKLVSGSRFYSVQGVTTTSCGRHYWHKTTSISSQGAKAPWLLSS